MRVLFNRKRDGHTFFDGAPQAMQRTYPRIAHVAKDELACYPCCDHLIIDEIRGHADKRQIATALANDLVPGGEADEGSEAFDSHGHAIMYICSNGLTKRGAFINHTRCLHHYR